MIKSYSEDEIVFEKELNTLDKFVITIIRLFGAINYAVISGYIAIFFGRTRATEDVDFFIEEISFEKFKDFATRVKAAGFWFVNGDDEENLYAILKEGSSLRVAEKGEWKPNAEIKFPRLKTDFYSLNNKIKVKYGKHIFYTSSIELQIAFKLYLGSNKDLEDAKHLYKLFEKYLREDRLYYFATELKVTDKLGILKWK